MKKTIALCAALLLAVAFTGCGKSSEDKSSTAPTSNSSENSDTKKSDKEEKIVVDPFDKVAFRVNEDENDIMAGYYPNRFNIIFNAAESPFGSHMSFTYSIEDMGVNEIVIKAKANVDDIQDFLDEYNYTVEETERLFSIKTNGIKTKLLTADQISGENKDKLIKGMLNKLESTFKMSENEEYTDILGELGISSNNPDYLEEQEKNKEEFEKEKAENMALEFSIDKMYAVVVNESKFNDSFNEKLSKKSNAYTDEDDTTYNQADLYLMRNDYKAFVFGIFKDNNDNYYCVKTSPEFNKGLLEEENLLVEFGRYFQEFENGGGGYLETCPNEETAYECIGIKKNGSKVEFAGDDYDDYEIVEIPLS